MMNIIYSIMRTVNYIVPKFSNYVYAMPHPNCKNDCYDLVNPNSDNLLCVINRLFELTFKEKTIVYLEIYNLDRRQTLVDYISQKNHNDNLVIKLLDSSQIFNDKRKYLYQIKNRLIRYSCRLWLCDTYFSSFFDKVSRQKIVCLNYATPFKMVPGIYDLSYIDYSFETSLLCASVHSALYKVKLENSFCLGYARNDNLLMSDRGSVIGKWIKSKINYSYSKIVVYAPTYRDYEGAYENSILGFQVNLKELDDFLINNRILLIVKMHPLQKISNNRLPKSVILYEKSYDFSLYDLLCVSDILISDYSSVMHDYILTKKPVILNLFDESKFKDTRGFSFDPINVVMPGEIVHDFNEFKQSLLKIIQGDYDCQNDEKICSMFHKNIDNNSTNRSALFIKKIIENDICDRPFLEPVNKK